MCLVCWVCLEYFGEGGEIRGTTGEMQGGRGMMDTYQQKQYEKSVDEGRRLAINAMGGLKEYWEKDKATDIPLAIRENKDSGRTLSVISELITMSMDKYGRGSQTTKWLTDALKEYIEKELRGEFKS